MKLASDCDTALVQTMYKWNDFFVRDGMFNNILRSGEWLITKLLKEFCDAGQTLVDKAYDFLDFTTWFSLDKIFTNGGVKVLLGILLAGALLFLGYTLIVNHGEKKPNVLQNIILVVACVLLIPQMFTFLNTSVRAGKDYVLGKDDKLSSTIISKATVDLAYVVQNGLNNYTIENGYIVGDNAKNGFGSNQENIDMLDINEVIEPDDDKWQNLSDEQKKYFQNYIDTDNDGNLKDYEIEEDSFLWVDMTSWYYRYHINFVAVWCMLIALAIAQFFIAFKTIRLIYELVVHQCLAYLLGTTDLTNGKRAKMILQTIGSSYVVMFINVVLLKCFMLAFEYITSNITNGLVQAIMMLVIALAVIDGPNLVERILGIDAGLKSGMAVVGGMFLGARAVTGSIKAGASAGAGAKKILFGGKNTSATGQNGKSNGMVQKAGKIAKGIGKGAYKTADNMAGVVGKKGAIGRGVKKVGKTIDSAKNSITEQGKQVAGNIDKWQRRNAPADDNAINDNLRPDDVSKSNNDNLNDEFKTNDNLQQNDVASADIVSSQNATTPNKKPNTKNASVSKSSLNKGKLEVKSSNKSNNSLNNKRSLNRNNLNNKTSLNRNNLNK